MSGMKVPEIDSRGITVCISIRQIPGSTYEEKRVWLNNAANICFDEGIEASMYIDGKAENPDTKERIQPIGRSGPWVRSRRIDRGDGKPDFVAMFRYDDFVTLRSFLNMWLFMDPERRKRREGA